MRKSGVASRTEGKHFSYAIVPASQLNTPTVYSSQNIFYVVATLNYFISYPIKKQIICSMPLCILDYMVQSSGSFLHVTCVLLFVF